MACVILRAPLSENVLAKFSLLHYVIIICFNIPQYHTSQLSPYNQMQVIFIPKRFSTFAVSTKELLILRGLNFTTDWRDLFLALGVSFKAVKHELNYVCGRYLSLLLYFLKILSYCEDMPGHLITAWYPELPPPSWSLRMFQNIIRQEWSIQDQERGAVQNLWHEWTSPPGWSPDKGLTVERGKPRPGSSSWPSLGASMAAPKSLLHSLAVVLTSIFSPLFQWFLHIQPPLPALSQSLLLQPGIIFSIPPEQIPQLCLTFWSRPSDPQVQRPLKMTTLNSFLVCLPPPQGNSQTTGAWKGEGQLQRAERKGKFFINISKTSSHCDAEKQILSDGHKIQSGSLLGKLTYRMAVPLQPQRIVP